MGGTGACTPRALSDGSHCANTPDDSSRRAAPFARATAFAASPPPARGCAAPGRARGVRRRRRPEEGARERRRARRRRADHARRVRLHARGEPAERPAEGPGLPRCRHGRLPGREEQAPRPARPGGRARAARPVAVRDRDRRRAGRAAAGAAPGTHVRRLRGAVQSGARAAGSHRGAGPGADPAAAARRGRLRPAERRGLGLRRRGRALLQEPPHAATSGRPRAGSGTSSSALARRPTSWSASCGPAPTSPRSRGATRSTLRRPRPAASWPGASRRARRSPRSTGSPSR